ncbi:LuxR C-terminal-related transcriptional regulator [Actinosynnema sp. CS-041913]|uniref:LuxR C-terminal-related transcriptional regulator n=1 Tax=Actinosynnema sp. CS-041913 TaxID=3239917 RepID=UPI003D8E4712
MPLGRQELLDRLERAVGPGLTTLVGPVGVGKSVLAAALARRRPDVRLADVPSGGLVASGVPVLATGREPLRLPGEVVVEVEPLALPENGLPLEVLAGVPSVAVLVRAARSVRPGFRLTEANRDDVVKLCRELDGVPLALVRAGERLKVAQPGELLARVPELLPELAEHVATLPGAAADLLTGLSLFAADFGADAVETVTGRPYATTWDLVELLVDKRFLVVREPETGGLRFRLPPTTRAFLVGRNGSDVRRRHCGFVLAEMGARADVVPEDMATAFGFLTAPEEARRFALAAAEYHAARGGLDEGLVWLRRALGLTERPGAPAASPLTARQEEVAELVARGLTNRAIARRLGISEWTAVNHVREVLRRLDISSRVEVARWVAARAPHPHPPAAPRPHPPAAPRPHPPAAPHPHPPAVSRS